VVCWNCGQKLNRREAQVRRVMVAKNEMTEGARTGKKNSSHPDSGCISSDGGVTRGGDARERGTTITCGVGSCEGNI